MNGSKTDQLENFFVFNNADLGIDLVKLLKKKMQSGKIKLDMNI